MMASAPISPHPLAEVSLHRQCQDHRKPELDDALPSTQSQASEQDGDDILQVSHTGLVDVHNGKGSPQAEGSISHPEPMEDPRSVRDSETDQTCSCRMHGEKMRLSEFLDSFRSERDDDGGDSEVASHHHDSGDDDNISASAYCRVCSCAAETTATPHGYTMECDCVVCTDCMRCWAGVRIDENRVNIECPVHGMYRTE